MIIASTTYANTYVTGTATRGQVYISLFDAATGQPANGNNLVVAYLMNINGNVLNETITIAGQSVEIYNGTLSDIDPANYFFSTFQINSVSLAPDPAPPVSTCDLAINFISVDKPESAPGAGDGQITVNASSGYGPVVYSIDLGATYQSSPTFTGLSGGLVEVTATDSNTAGCTVQGSITVPILSNLLTSDPGIALPGGNVSRWNAAFNPIIFTYQRKDFEVTKVSLDSVSGNAAVSVNCDISALVTAISANNQALANATNLGVVLTNINAVYVYINTVEYSGTYQVLSVSDTNQIIIDTPFTTNSTGFININLLRPYYQVRTLITYHDVATGRQNSIVSVNRPDNTGLVKADISNFLQSLLRAKDESNFTQTNYLDDNLSASYQIAYAEFWDGKLNGAEALTYIPTSSPYYVIYAAKQLGDRYGGNLAAYVPFPHVIDSTMAAKWITDFAEPAYSNGYPFDIGFIYSDELTGLQLYCEVTPLDINRNALPGGSQSSFLLNEDGSPLLNDDGSQFILISQATSIVTITPQIGLNRMLINRIFNDDTKYFTLAIKYDDVNGTHTITQTQTIRIDDAVDEQSVYLRWIGLTGSWNYYRFVYNQDVSLDVQNAVIIKNYVSDWENQDSIEEVIGKSAGQKIKVMAEDLSVADIKGLQSIKYSPKVQMLINKNPVKWQTVVLNTATFSEYETINGQAPFSIIFNLPGINIQTQ